MRFSLASSSACCSIVDDTFIYNQMTNRYYKLNTTGSFLLNQLQESRSTEELAQLLCDNFSGISLHQGQAVAEHFIETLITAQLVKISPHDCV